MTLKYILGIGIFFLSPGAFAEDNDQVLTPKNEAAIKKAVEAAKMVLDKYPAVERKKELPKKKAPAESSKTFECVDYDLQGANESKLVRPLCADNKIGNSQYTQVPIIINVKNLEGNILTGITPFFCKVETCQKMASAKACCDEDQKLGPAGKAPLIKFINEKNTKAQEAAPQIIKGSDK